MSRHKLRGLDPHFIRNSFRNTKALSRLIFQSEGELVRELSVIDEHRYFIRLGFRSLTGYCRRSLGFNRNQSQRLVTLVRRHRMKLEISVRSINEDE